MIDIAKKLKNAGVAFIDPPKKIPLFLKIGIAISKKITKKDLLVPKLLVLAPQSCNKFCYSRNYGGTWKR